ncbi:MAG: hypothetical protein ABSG91_10020 [Syntrophobacteraceae bacterium]|jgi:hypothetical protein
MSDPQFPHAARENDYGGNVTKVKTERRVRKRFSRSLLFGLSFSLLFILCFSGPTNAQQITAQGQRLARFLDNMNVERLWLSHQKVNWRTGNPRGESVTDRKPHTHCSAFVAATAEKLDIYILRPPEHSSIMLANAQADWLSRQGSKYGWQAVRTAEKAQQLANRGILVVAVYKARNPGNSGHIAIVRPQVKSPGQIQQDGPQIIQAGMENYSSTSLKQGFRHHGHAWERRKIRFFSHAVNWGSV